MHATRGQVYMLNGSGNLTSVSPNKKKIHQWILCPIHHCPQKGFGFKEAKTTLQKTQAQRKASTRAFAGTDLNSAVFVCIIKYIFTVKTPTISLPQKMELFLNVGEINISRLCVTAWMQMYHFLNLIYRIMGSNNASLFHNEQSNMRVGKKKQLHLFFFHPRPSLPIAFWY